MNGGPKPGWLDSYIAAAWIPTAGVDLRHLKTSLAPHAKRFEEVYRPIRHGIVAHRLMSDAQAREELFGKTNREEVAMILDFLHDLIETILHLYMNGSKPVLGTRDFRMHNQRIRDGVSEVLQRLYQNQGGVSIKLRRGSRESTRRNRNKPA
jgi:hypothetical protein